MADLREQGNALFKQGEFLKAAGVYTRALKAAGADKEACAVLHRCVGKQWHTGWQPQCGGPRSAPPSAR
jgi:hypothetical protein